MAKVTNEYAVELREVANGEAHFRTDHAGCDDHLYVPFRYVPQFWERVRTAAFDGYRRVDVETCGQCGRAYRGYVPKALMVEAWLR